MTEGKQILVDKQSADIVHGTTSEKYPYLECENSSQIKAYYMATQDETINSDIQDALKTCDMFGRTLYFKMGQATLTAAIIKLFDMLSLEKLTGNTDAIKSN